MVGDKHPILLLGVTLELVDTFWHRAQAEREAMWAAGIMEVEVPHARGNYSESIMLCVSDHVDPLHFIARATIDEEVFTKRSFERLDPNDPGEWLDRWAVLDDPVIGNWIIRHGNSFPAFAAYVFAVESLHNQLIGLRDQSKLPVSHTVTKTTASRKS